jgi:hypothetical protein
MFSMVYLPLAAYVNALLCLLSTCSYTLMAIHNTVETDDNIRCMMVIDGDLHPISCHEGPEGEKRYSYTLPLTLALQGGV